MGRGGFGTVWQVEDPLRPGRQLALKVLSEPSARGRRVSREAAAREFRLASQVRHPVVLEFLEAGILEPGAGDARTGLPYLLSELFPGLPLGPRWNPADLLPVAYDLLSALDAIHAAGWRHGDLKPGNVLVRRAGPRPEVRLLDFGLAEECGRRGIKRGGGGTPRYFSPEALRGVQPDHSADFYALGLLLYECICGVSERPLAEHLLRTREGRLVEDVHAARLPERWSRLLGRLLDSDPAARLNSGAEGISLLGGESRTSRGVSLSSLPAFEAARPIGREDFFETLSRALEGAPRRRPHPQLILVEGGAGQGKSRLVREAESRAFVTGLRSLRWHSARELARAGEARSREAREGPRGRAADSWVERACLAASGGGTARPTRAAEWLANAVFERLIEQPTLVAVDDMDRLAPLDLKVVRLIVERLRNVRQRLTSIPTGTTVPVMLLTVSPRMSRTRELQRWWGHLAALPWAARFSLRPWTDEEVAAYLDRALPPRRRLGDAEALLCREGGGNPARLRLLLQDLAVRGELRLEAGAWVCQRSSWRGLPALPGDRERFHRHWSALDQDIRDFLGVCAVCAVRDAPVRVDVIASALGSPEGFEYLLRRVEKLDEPLTVEPGGDGAVLIRRVQRAWIGRAGGPRHRQRWRGLLTRSTAPLAERVYQELRLGRIALERVLEAAGEGGAAAERLLAYHADGRRKAPPSDRAATALRLGRLLHGLGEFLRAGRYLLLARRLTSIDAERVEIDILLGEAAVFRGRPEEGAALLEPVLRTLAPGDGLRPQVLHANAFCKLQLGRADEALEAVESALKEHPRELALENLLGLVAMALDQPARAESVFRQALGEATERGVPSSVLAVFRSNYGRVLRLRGEFEGAARLHRQAAAEFAASGARAQAAVAYANLGVSLRHLGDFEAAVEAATTSLAIHRELGDERSAAASEVNLGILARELGLPGTAARRFRAAAAVAGRKTSGGRPVLEHPAVLENQLLLALEVGDDAELPELIARRDALSAPATASLPETLLLELRLWLAGKRLDAGRLQLLLGGRDLGEADAAFLAELALAREALPGAAGGDSGLNAMADEARRVLRGLASSSHRALFYCRLVELEDPRSDTERRRAFDYLRSAVHEFPVRDARRRALKALLRHATDEETRERARGGLRRLLDEILFDLEHDRREIYRRRPETREVLELTRRSEPVQPALKRARQVIQEVFRFNGEILKETDPANLMRRIVDAAMALTDAERGVVVMREHGRLRVLAARTRRGDLADPEGQISHTVLERALEEGVARVTTDAREDLTLKSIASVEELGLRSILCVPLRAHRSHVEAALYLDNPFERAVFDSEDLALAETFCSQAALAWTAADRRRQTASLLRQLRQANRQLRAELCVSRRDEARRSRRMRKELGGLVGDSAAMREVFHLIEVVAPTEIPVLITGESGTGKELVARAIHRLSRRATRPFVAENCGAVPPSLLESALFGHVKGAFTGADRDYPGIFKMADGGTLFLDEIAEMPANLQARLLRVLQEGEVRPLGAQAVVKVDVRVVAATNRDVRLAMQQGRFREDLFYRLQGAEIHVPSLGERREDVPLLVEHFLETLAGDGPVKKVGVETMERLASYPWPGNVRELENEVRRLVVLCPAPVISTEYLSSPIREGHQPNPLPSESEKLRTLREAEHDAIRAAMQRLDGHRVKVAKALGISRSTLYLKLREIDAQ